MDHLLPLGMVKPLFSRSACFRKLLPQPQIERTAVAIARHGQDRCVVGVFLIEQRLDRLRPIFVIKQHHSFGGTLDALLDISLELRHGMKHCLARQDGEDAFGCVGQCGQLRQRGFDGMFDQEQHKPWPLGLAQQRDEVLHPRQDGRPLV